VAGGHNSQDHVSKLTHCRDLGYVRYICAFGIDPPESPVIPQRLLSAIILGESQAWTEVDPTTMNTNAPPVERGGLYLRMTEAVRSRIPRPISLLSSTQRGPGTQTTRSRSSSTSSGSIEEIDPRAASPDVDSLHARDDEQMQLAVRKPGPSPRSSNLDVAQLGCQLTLSLQRQASLPRPDEALVRKLHVDAVYYLAKALPQDLTPTEAARISEAVPQAVHEQRIAISGPQRRTTVVRRLTAQSTALLTGCLFLIIPLLVTTLNSALVYERQHRLTERGVSFVQETIIGFSNRAPAQTAQSSLFRGFVVRLWLWLVDMFSEVVTGAEEGYDRAVSSRGQVDR
jgi:hypothetical protein